MLGFAHERVVSEAVPPSFMVLVHKLLKTQQRGTHTQTFQTISKDFQFPPLFFPFRAFPVMANLPSYDFSRRSCVAREVRWDPSFNFPLV